MSHWMKNWQFARVKYFSTQSRLGIINKQVCYSETFKVGLKALHLSGPRSPTFEAETK